MPTSSTSSSDSGRARTVQPSTVAAVATPPGQGGVAIVRISGPAAADILARVFRASARSFSGFVPRHLHHGHALDAQGRALDEVLAVHMPGPRSYTGEDVAEIQCHGGPAVTAAILEAVFSAGAEPAGPGEFTRRAFLNGRLDLTRAEAVAELIAAPSPAAARMARDRLDGVLGRRVRALFDALTALRAQLCVAVDFPEDEVECLSPEELDLGVADVAHAIEALLAGYERARCWRDGARVVLAGRVNAGKSSLMNALLGRQRAIVADQPGTTRDFLEEGLILDGLPVRLFDTAGLRATGDIVELEGVRRSRDLAEQADLVLLIHDASGHADSLDTGSGDGQEDETLLCERLGPERMLVVRNKADLAPSPVPSGASCPAFPPPGFEAVDISARTGQGIEELTTILRAKLLRATGGCEPGGCDPARDEADGGEVAPNLRQSRNLRLALEELQSLRQDLAGAVPYDLLGVRLETACAQLSEITGDIAPQTVLDAVFSDFCIGK